MPVPFNRSLLLIVLLLSAGPIHSQDFRRAGYMDGVVGLNNFFKENLKLDQLDLDRDFHGTVILRIQVNFLGTVDSMYVWFSPTKELGEEALRVLNLTSGSWISARKDGGFCNAWVQFPYHVCKSSWCGYTSTFYNEYKKKSQKFFLKGDREKGIEFLRKAVNVEPSHGEDFYRLATLLMEDGGDPYLCTYFEIAQQLSGNLYPAYFEYCGVDKEQYLLTRQEEKEAFDEYISHARKQSLEEKAWQAAFPGDKPSIAHRFPGGADTLRTFLARRLSFPENARRVGQGGLSVSSLSISPEGFIEEIAILNSLGPWIDREVMRLLRNTGGHWKAVDQYSENQSFIFQISFRYSPGCQKKDLLTLSADTILDELSICTILRNAEPKTNKWFKSMAEYLISGHQYSSALMELEEGSRRDPFNPYYYEQKAVCYRGLGWEAMETLTEGLLEAYHAGDSLAFLDQSKAIGIRRIIQATKDGAYSVKEIRLDSTIIYSGKLSSLNPEIKNGNVYFFNKQGKLYVAGQYRDDYPIGLWNYYNASAELETFLDYNAVYEFLLEEETHPFMDSTYMRRSDLGANDVGSFAEVRSMPRFKGGDPQRTFVEYIKEQVKYPVYASHHGIEGRVVVQFTVDQEGRVRNPVVISGVSPELNMEALRVLISSPPWKPGKLKKNPVAVVYTFPVEFSLNDNPYQCY